MPTCEEVDALLTRLKQRKDRWIGGFEADCLVLAVHQDLVTGAWPTRHEQSLDYHTGLEHLVFVWLAPTQLNLGHALILGRPALPSPAAHARQPEGTPHATRADRDAPIW